MKNKMGWETNALVHSSNLQYFAGSLSLLRVIIREPPGLWADMVFGMEFVLECLMGKHSIMASYLH